METKGTSPAPSRLTSILILTLLIQSMFCPLESSAQLHKLANVRTSRNGNHHKAKIERTEKENVEVDLEEDAPDDDGLKVKRHNVDLIPSASEYKPVSTYHTLI